MDYNNLLLPAKRLDNEILMKQHARVFWFTGLSGAGKTTLARAVDDALRFRGYICQLLDGDLIREGINSNLGFSESDRMENIRRVAEVSKLFLHCGVITICSLISPARQMREMARRIIPAQDFYEIYINAPLEVCEKRDVKGLYARARSGEIKEFTGISSPYEPPVKPAIEIRTDLNDIRTCVDGLLQFMFPLIEWDNAEGSHAASRSV